VKYGAAITAPNVSPTCIGYTFGGWGDLGTMGAADKTIKAENWTECNSDLTITTAADLKNFATNVNNGNNYADKLITLANDIDLSGYTDWTPIGTSEERSFKGTFDGGGHTITGLTINSGGGLCGLFGYLDGATIENLFLKGVNVVGRDTDVGGLAGKANNGSVIKKCAVTGTVKGFGGVGGLAGSTWTDSGKSATRVENCFVRVTLTHTGNRYDTAGISGWNESDSIQIVNSYSACTGELRPMAGCSDGTAVQASQITNSFYDKYLSEYDQYDSKDTLRSFGRTTEQMKTKSTYTDWDFDSIWAIDSSVNTNKINDGYPYLKIFENALKVSE